MDKQRKLLPIGSSDYIRLQDLYYVDKTRLIKKILDEDTMVTLFNRPRRFGKTLAMDMLRVFFEKTDDDTSRYFKDKEIWRYGEAYRVHQGKYPVICLSFKDICYNSWQSSFLALKETIRTEYWRHTELLESEGIDAKDKEFISRILEGNATEVDYASSLRILSVLLQKHYQTKTIIIIDEYDTPIQSGHDFGFYDEVILFMRNLFSGAFKDNSSLAFGFLSGVLRIAHESLFSGLNNLSVDSVLDSRYSDCFGFTVDETRALLTYYGKEDKMEELSEWYDGYLFGSTEIYNPWSVLNYVAKGCEPQAYWTNTGSNSALRELLADVDEDTKVKLKDLLLGDDVFVEIDFNVNYRDMDYSQEHLFSILLSAGYLKAYRKMWTSGSTVMAQVAIPNREISYVYRSEILKNLSKDGAFSRSTSTRIVQALVTEEIGELEKYIGKYLEESVSYYDTASEAFYHGLVLGLVSIVDSHYRVLSNRESGLGRYDIALIPRKDNLAGIIIELKVTETDEPSSLERVATAALRQIDEKDYVRDMKDQGVSDIRKIAMVFSGKRVAAKICH